MMDEDSAFLSSFMLALRSVIVQFEEKSYLHLAESECENDCLKPETVSTVSGEKPLKRRTRSAMLADHLAKARCE